MAARYPTHIIKNVQCSRIYSLLIGQNLDINAVCLLRSSILSELENFSKLEKVVVKVVSSHELTFLVGFYWHGKYINNIFCDINKFEFYFKCYFCR